MTFDSEETCVPPSDIDRARKTERRLVTLEKDQESTAKEMREMKGEFHSFRIEYKEDMGSIQKTLGAIANGREDRRFWAEYGKGILALFLMAAIAVFAPHLRSWLGVIQ